MCDIPDGIFVDGLTHT